MKSNKRGKQGASPGTTPLGWRKDGLRRTFEAKELSRSMLRSATRGDVEEFQREFTKAFAMTDVVDFDRRDDHGMTMLHHVAAQGLWECVKLLAHSGKCSFLIRDHSGRYVSDLAILWKGYFEMGEFLAEKQVEQAHREGVPAYVVS